MRENTPLDTILAAKLFGGGGSVTPASIVTATGQMTAAQAAETRGNLGVAPAETVVTVEGSTPTVTPAANTIYECGELTSLTVTDPPATGAYVIKFTSGSTPTTTTVPATVIFPEPFAAAANTHYEINVEDGYAVVMGWPISGGGGA